MKRFVKVLSLVMAMVMSLVIIPDCKGLTASAASGSISSLPLQIKSYPISTGNNTPAYSYIGASSKSGTIYASDLCTIKNIYSNGWLYVNYPTSRGSRNLYVKASAFFKSNTYVTASITKYAVAYRRSSGSATIGSVDSADNLVYVIGNAVNSRYQIVYKVTGSSYYKMGWVTTSAVEFSSSSFSSSRWSYPMKNASCTWRSYDSNLKSWSELRGGSTSGRNYHLGIDITGYKYVVYAAAAGKVKKVGYNSANGNFIIIEHNVNGKTVYSFYAHLASYCVKGGDKVRNGTKIGIAGNTGSSSSGRHLHFAVVDSYWSSGGYWGYAYRFSGNRHYFKGVTYYNPNYLIKYNKLP